MIETETRDETVTVEELAEPGDHDKFAHYVPKDQLLEGMVNGLPVIALCGKIWVPTRDGEKFPVCQACAEIFKTLSPGK